MMKLFTLLKPQGRFCFSLLCIVCVSCATSPSSPTGSTIAQEREWTNNDPSGAPKNVIISIGDGMGPEQVKAAGMYAGTPGSMSFEQFPHQAEVTTHAANDPVTDSAASATAIATGVKVNKGVISLATPGDGQPLTTVLEIFQGSGKSTGLVTTTEMTHATPAAFASHQPSRNNQRQISQDYFNTSRPKVLFGGGGSGMSVKAAETAGYQVVTTARQMQQLDTETATRVSGQFGKGHLPYEYDGMGNLPHLPDMTKTALNILDNDPDGLFLMVEGGRIDHAGHANDIERNVMETLEFAKAVTEVVKWAQNHPDTLIIVTADHETGGLKVLDDRDQGNIPQVSWSTWGHTGVNVAIYGWGVNSEQISGVMDNTDIFHLLLGQQEIIPE